ncbi:hypothetical protein [Fundidesulfovibrio terrae]|nr:hypothetical protein [Fundidesulfovibrio terrae]
MLSPVRTFACLGAMAVLAALALGSLSTGSNGKTRSWEKKKTDTQ